MAELRKALREAGGEYKVYKNTLVRFAVDELGLEVEALLTGRTAIAFVGEQPDGSAGDPVALARALKDFAKANESLVIKAGGLDEQRLTVEEILVLAEIAPREELLARLAGAMAAPMQQFAALLNALPQNLAYALKALIDEGGAPGAPVCFLDVYGGSRFFESCHNVLDGVNLAQVNLIIIFSAAWAAVDHFKLKPESWAIIKL